MSLRSRILLAVCVMAVSAVVFIGTAIRASVYDPSQAIAPTPLELPATTSAARPKVVTSDMYPARVAIPAIGVNAKVQALGIVAGNRMQAPSNFTDIGWFKYGAVPGVPGTAVMYGHLDNGLGLSGVFKDLGKLKQGDVVTVTTKGGKVLNFKIVDSEVYPYQSVPQSALGEAPNATVSKITFITCSGTGIYDKTMGFTYDHRLVVTAQLEGSEQAIKL